MDFIGKRKIWFIISAVIILAGLFSIIAQGFNWGIDFAGGTLLQIQFTEQVELQKLRKGLDGAGYPNMNIQVSEDNIYILKSALLSESEQDELIDKLSETTGALEMLRSEGVGPTVGVELRKAGLLSLIIALVLMTVYITIRFEIRFALAGIIVLFHDLFVMIAFFSIFRIEVNSTFVAALLTIFGYSINDTIVIFDRIRENMKNMGKAGISELPHLINGSLKQTMRRSLNTSLTTLLVLVALLFFGGETTKDFVTALIIGVISGTYSSVFIASSLWYEFKKKDRNLKF